MDRQRNIALVLGALILVVCACGAGMLFGPGPLFTAGYIVAGILFVGTLVWVSWTGYIGWKETKSEREEFEQAFLEEIEREFLGGVAAEVAGISETLASPMVAGSGRDGRDNGDSGAAGGLGVSPTILDSSSVLATDSTPGNGAEMSVDSAVESAPAFLAQSASFGMPSFAPAIEQLAANLKRLGVIDMYEGKLDLPPPAPPAPIYRLRGGGLILLLEDWENHRFLEFQSRRFRAIVVRGPEGKPIVVRCFQDFMTDEMEGPKEERA